MAVVQASTVKMELVEPSKPMDRESSRESTGTVIDIDEVPSYPAVTMPFNSLTDIDELGKRSQLTDAQREAEFIQALHDRREELERFERVALAGLDDEDGSNSKGYFSCMWSQREEDGELLVLDDDKLPEWKPSKALVR